MTGTITLSDGGQNYIEFDILDDVITEVRPARLEGWKGTRVLNANLRVGGKLEIGLQWKDYDFPLKYQIIGILEEVWVVPHKIITEGTATATEPYYLIDLYGMFIIKDVRIGDTVRNLKHNILAIVTKVESEYETKLDRDIMKGGDRYSISREMT